MCVCACLSVCLRTSVCVCVCNVFTHVLNSVRIFFTHNTEHSDCGHNDCQHSDCKKVIPKSLISVTKLIMKSGMHFIKGCGVSIFWPENSLIIVTDIKAS